ncbi:MAG: preprotein translocase subunit YajC [Tissierellia bacterium]|nr:preprotein translocase subunit YajC [Tissierellia bacterium]
MVPMIIMTLAMFAIFYFLIIRPQKKREQEAAEMKSSLKVGDEILTVGGIKGKVIKLTDDYMIIETSNSKTRMEFTRAALLSVVNPEVLKTEDKEEKEEAKEEAEVNAEAEDSKDE